MQKGYLTGQALVELKSAEEGTLLYIFQGAAEKSVQVPPTLKTGDKMTLPSPANVLSRFPK